MAQFDLFKFGLRYSPSIETNQNSSVNIREVNIPTTKINAITGNCSSNNIEAFIVLKNINYYNQTLDAFLPTKKDHAMKDKSKVLVIISCSKSKLSSPAPAIRLYQGDIFQTAQT